MDETEQSKAAQRDKFARAALQGILANDVCMREILNRNDDPMAVADSVTRRAFLYANECMKHTALKFE